MDSFFDDDPICEEAAETNLNWRILTIMSTVVVLDVTSVFLLSLYLYSYVTNRSLHPNLRALTTSITVALILRNVLTCIRAVRMLVASVTAVNNHCSLLTSKVVCSVVSVINANPVQCASWGFVIVTVERIVATVFTKKYEKMKFFSLATICGLAPWVILGYRTVGDVIRATEANPELLPYCSSLSSRIFNILQIINYQVPLAGGTALVSLVVYVVNKKAKKFESTSGAAHLSTRYQRLENIEATKIITVHTICFLIFYIQNIYLVYLISQLQFKKLPQLAVAKELSSLTFPVHGNVHVILALFLSRKLRQKFLSFWIIQKTGRLIGFQLSNPGQVSAALKNNYDSQREVYFKTYQKQWN